MAQPTPAIFGAVPAVETRPGPGAPAPRWARAAAIVSDFLWLVIGSLGVALTAITFLLWRTSWGAIDASAADTALAAALLLATVPAWLAWIVLGVIADHATPGQSGRGIRVRTATSAWPAARLIRLVMHPLSVPGWLWIAAVAFLLEAGWVSWIATVVAVAIVFAGVGSAVLVALGRRSFHDLVAHTDIEVCE